MTMTETESMFVQLERMRDAVRGKRTLVFDPNSGRVVSQHGYRLNREAWAEIGQECDRRGFAQWRESLSKHLRLVDETPVMGDRSCEVAVAIARQLDESGGAR